MTEKEKAIEDETIELSAESTEKKTKKPHRRRAIVITVVVLALLTAGGIAWKAHADRLRGQGGLRGRIRTPAHRDERLEHASERVRGGRGEDR